MPEKCIRRRILIQSSTEQLGFVASKYYSLALGCGVMVVYRYLFIIRIRWDYCTGRGIFIKCLVRDLPETSVSISGSRHKYSNTFTFLHHSCLCYLSCFKIPQTLYLTDTFLAISTHYGFFNGFLKYCISVSLDENVSS